jgi:hypothetical protein
MVSMIKKKISSYIRKFRWDRLQRKGFLIYIRKCANI